MESHKNLGVAIPSPASSTISSASTGTRTLYTDVVKGITHKPYPPVKIKTKVSDEDSICSEITQDTLLLKDTPDQMRYKSHHQDLEPIAIEESNHIKKVTKITISAAQPDVTTQKY